MDQRRKLWFIYSSSSVDSCYVFTGFILCKLARLRPLTHPLQHIISLDSESVAKYVRFHQKKIANVFPGSTVVRMTQISTLTERD